MRLSRVTLLLAVCLLALVGCNKRSHKDIPADAIFLRPQYSKGFIVYDNDSCYTIIIRNPSDTINEISKIRIKKSDIGKDRTIACFSASHLACCDKLNHIQNVIGIPDTIYYSNSIITKHLRNTGKTFPTSVTLGVNPKIELLISLRPDFILASEYQNAQMVPLNTAGLTVIPILEYLETDPRGRAEWLKIYGLLFDESETADTICTNIFSRYNDLLQSRTDSTDNRPTIIDCMEYQGYWYISGGNSYIATLYRDAGYDFLNRKDTHTGSVPISQEEAITFGSKADFWRMATSYNGTLSVKFIEVMNDYYKYFTPLQNSKAIVCNTLLSPYFMEGALEPDIILNELICIRTGRDYNEKYYYIAR